MLTFERTLAINFIKANLRILLVLHAASSKETSYVSHVFVKLCLLSIIIINLIAVMLKDNPTTAVMVI